MSIKKFNIYQFVNKNTAPLGLFAAILAVSTAAIFIRKAQTDISSLVIATYRLSLAVIFLFPFSIRKVIHERQVIRGRNTLLLIGSGMLLGIHFAAWITSLEFTNVVSSTVLVTTSPIWVTLLSPFLLKEKLPKVFVVGLMVAIVGIVLISLNGMCSFSPAGMHCGLEDGFNGRQGSWGNFLALFGAWCASGYMICGRTVRKELSNQSYSFLVYSVAALTLLAISLATRQPLLAVDASNLVWLVLLALIPQVIGHSLLNWALGKLPAAYVSLSLLGEPAGSAALAFFILNEKPSPLEVLGSAVIIFGIYWANKPRRSVEEADPTL